MRPLHQIVQMLVCGQVTSKADIASRLDAASLPILGAACCRRRCHAADLLSNFSASVPALLAETASCVPCKRHLRLLQGARCGCHNPADVEAGVHGCRRRLCASLKAICTCFGVPFAAAVVQPVATAAAATPVSTPQPVSHPVLEEVSLPSGVFRVCGVDLP